MSEGRLYQIYEFRNIAGVKSTNPGATQHGKFVKWNNTNTVFDYTKIGSGDVDETWLTEYITNIFTVASTDNYLTSIAKVGSYGQFNRVTGVPLYLNLGALAWLDDVPVDKSGVVLPGDTRVLFADDNNTTFGGEVAFTYNKGANKLQFQGTGLVFDKTGGTEGTFKEGVRYLGGNSWSIGHGDTSTEAGAYNFSGGYRAGHPLAAGSLNNLILGREAGYQMISTAIGNIFLGPYTGKYSNTSNTFFLDNTDHGSTATEIANSFLYGDLVGRRLFLRNRLSVKAEGMFGTSGILAGAGEAGMFQMLPVSAGVIKPQYYSGGIWNDFANAVDVYLSNVVYSAGDLTFTLSDASTIGPIDISALNTTTFATSPSSPSTGQTATSDYGYLQISNSAFTNNEGFTYKAGLSYSNALNELSIPGALKLATKAQYAASDGNVIYDGTHMYGRLASAWVQLDNDANNGEINTGINVGSGDVNWFKQKNASNELEFRSFNLWGYDAVWNPHHRLTQDYTDGGDTVLLGTTAELNYLETIIGTTADRRLDRPKDGEMLPLRALRQGTGCTLTQTDEYILIDATGAGGGEINTATSIGTGLNLSTTTKTGASIEFNSIKSDDVRALITLDAVNHDIELNLDLNFASADAAVVGANEASLKSTITGTGVTGNAYTYTYKKLTSPLSSVTIVQTATEVQLEVGSAAATGTNLGAGIVVYKGSAPAFQFKTLNTVGLNSHINVTANGDGNTINFAVNDIATSTTGTGEQLFTMAANDWDSIQKKINAKSTSGLTVTTVTNSIQIDQPILIPKFTFVPIPVFTSGAAAAMPVTATTGLLEFKANYDNDVRGGDTLVATVLHNLNIGNGLAYDAVTNTLHSVTANGVVAADYALRSVTTTVAPTTSYYEYTFTVDNALGTDPTTYSLKVPQYILPLSSGTPGAIIVDPSIKTWSIVSAVQRTTKQLTYDGLTGVLSISPDLVTYDIQNNIYDIDNTTPINTKRTQVRANIGSAYITGSSTVDFNSKYSIVAEKLVAASVSHAHELGNLEILASTIRGTSGASKWEYSVASDTFIQQTSTTINIKTGSSGTNGRINIYSQAGVKMFMFDTDTGNLYVKGNIYANADIEAFAGKSF